jgi:hypothetical protein
MRRLLLVALFTAACTPFSAAGDADGSAPSDAGLEASSDAAALACPNGALSFEDRATVEIAPSPAYPSVAPPDLTVEAWVLPDATIGETEVHIASHHDHESSDGWVLMLFGGLRFRLYAGDGPGRMTEAYAPITLGEWHHVAAVVDLSGAGKIRLYIDGVLATDATNIASPAAAYAGPLRFGLASYVNHFSYTGIIDEVRLSSVARYARDFEPPYPLPEGEDDTIGTWHFLEGSGAETREARDRLLPGVLRGVEGGPRPQWTTPSCPKP